MSTQYTPKVGLRYWQLNDRNWHVPYEETCLLLDAVTAIGSLAVRQAEYPSASLDVNVAAGIFLSASGSAVSYAGASGVAVTTATTNYLYLTDAGSLVQNTTGFPTTSNIVPLAVIVAGATTLTSVTDARRAFRSSGAGPVGIRLDSTYTPPQADVDGATVTFDLAVRDLHTLTMAGNRTLAVSGATVGQEFTVILKQDATGSRVPTWFSGILWEGGSPPTLTTTANKQDVFRFLTIGSGSYLGWTVGLNF